MEPLVSRKKQSYPTWEKYQGKGVGGILLWGWSLAGSSRGRDARKYLLSSSIRGPEINRRNSSGISARSKYLLLQRGIHTHGPRQKPAAAGRLLSWQQGWRKGSGRLQAQAGGQVVRRQQQGCLAAKAEAQLKRRASTPCSGARVVADEGNPLEALSLLNYTSRREKAAFPHLHELFNSF